MTATLRPDLKIEYLKNYVAEAYLIAAKTADKLRYLQPAQSLLAWSLRCLLIYIVLLAYTQWTTPPTKAPPPTNKVEVIEAPPPFGVQVAPSSAQVQPTRAEVR